jgi:hypothetical protein
LNSASSRFTLAFDAPALQQLAIHVIRQAVADATWRPMRPPHNIHALRFQQLATRHWDEARRFLASESFRFWCHVAGCNPDRISHAITNGMQRPAQANPPLPVTAGGAGRSVISRC